MPIDLKNRSGQPALLQPMARRLVGVTLIAAPFIGIAAFVYHEEGIQLVIVVFGLTALIAGLIFVGVTMLFK